MTAWEWLGTWENIPAPGKHTKKCRAAFSHGYRFGGFQSFRDPHSMPHRGGVDRAIYADGTVTDVPPSWIHSPQVRAWMQEKETAGQKILKWLRG